MSRIGAGPNARSFGDWNVRQKICSSPSKSSIRDLILNSFAAASKLFKIKSRIELFDGDEQIFCRTFQSPKLLAFGPAPIRDIKSGVIFKVFHYRRQPQTIVFWSPGIFFSVLERL